MIHRLIRLPKCVSIEQHGKQGNRKEEEMRRGIFVKTMGPNSEAETNDLEYSMAVGCECSQVPQPNFRCSLERLNQEFCG